MTGERVHLSKNQRAQATRAAHRLLTVEFRDFKSHSTPGKFHRVRIEVDGKVFCSCQGWCVKKIGKPRSCVHTSLMLLGRRHRVTDEFLYVLGEEAK